MPITNITIENFKGVGSKVSIPLRPLTLLFGANSAGKSTILQAMLYMRELLERQNADADVLQASGSAINLGGFRQFVHGHDLKKTVRIGITMTMDDDGLPIYPVMGLDSDNVDEDPWASLFANLKDIGVLLDVAWDPDTEKPWIVRYSVEIDGREAGVIEAAPRQNSNIMLLPLNLILDFPGGSFQEEDPIDIDFEETALSADDLDPDGTIRATCEYVVPRFGRAMEGLDFHFFDPVDACMEPDYISHISRIFVGAGELVLRELQRIRYIGPIRTIPERGFTAVRSPNEGRWADGSAAWDLLHNDKNTPNWLNEKQIANLGLGYRIEKYRYLEIPCESVLGGAIESVMMGVGNDSFDLDIIPAADFSRLEVSARLRIVAEESNVEVAPSDIGVGVSQVLPVVVGAMAPNYKILSVEQPELHIHPAIQCRLADLLALQTLCKERMVLLETHSEHLILRLLRRVRELNDGNLEPGDPEIRTDDLSILYVTSRPEGLEITELPVTEDGDFAKPWPKGFFPERTTELF
jgi:ABC-type ATPase involved in cell division